MGEILTIEKLCLGSKSINLEEYLKVEEAQRLFDSIINDTVSSLTSTYSSAKILELIGEGKMAIVIVDELPVSGESYTIYFVPSEDSGATNSRDEYMWVDNKWELIGSTKIDLSDYYTKSEVDEALSGKSDTSHTHQIADVSGLTEELAGKAASAHTHSMSDVSGLAQALSGKSDTGHTHGMSDVNGLETALGGKANSEHSHEMSDVNGLGAALEGKSNTGHTHSISEVTNLQTELNGKQDVVNVTVEEVLEILND